MKRFLLVFATGICLFAGACSKKDADANQVQPTATSSSIKTVDLRCLAKQSNSYTLAELRSLDKDVQRIVFSDMDIHNRARIWRERISDEISNTTDPTKISQLNVLLDLASDANYEQACNQLEDDKNAPQLWVEQNMMLFGYDEMKRIVTTLDPQGLMPGMGGGGGQASVDCGCNRKDDWCISSEDRQARCLGACDNTSSWGCGSLWLKPCNSNCM
jgi:hypothetical protein